MDNILLNIKNVEKIYGDGESETKALRGVSFNVREGEFLGIMGTSGSGKTTLLNCIATIDKVTSGEIFLRGEDITNKKERELARFRRNNLGFVFQDYNLLDTLNIYENIAFPLSISKLNHKDIKNKVIEVADELGIMDIVLKYPHEVSGGQRQRAACARAMINNPQIVLADEPTGALDSNSSMVLLDTLKKMNEKRGVTIIMVTHDVLAASYASRILLLKDGLICNEIFNKGVSKHQFSESILKLI